jgi:hypothetical protein
MRANLASIFRNQKHADLPKASLGVLLSRKLPIQHATLLKIFGGYNTQSACFCSLLSLSKGADRLPPVKRYVLATEGKTNKRIKAVFANWPKKIAQQILKASTKKADLIALLRKTDEDDEIDKILRQLDLEGYSRDFLDAIRDDLLAAYKQGGATGLGVIGFADDEAIIKLVNRHAVDFARDRAADLVGMRWDNDLGQFVDNPNSDLSITRTTREGLRNIIADSLEDGPTVDSLADTIAESYGFSDARAEMIARTELANAHVEGNLDAWKESGQVSGKKSILSDLHPEEDVCDENEAADVIDLDAPFPSGDMGPPYHPNCLCDVVPVLSPEIQE